MTLLSRLWNLVSGFRCDVCRARILGDDYGILIVNCDGDSSRRMTFCKKCGDELERGAITVDDVDVEA